MSDLDQRSPRSLRTLNRPQETNLTPPVQRQNGVGHGTERINIGALMIRMGFWGPRYHSYNKEPQNGISSYFGAYITDPLAPSASVPPCEFLKAGDQKAFLTQP